jgi:putative endonuclease
MMNKKQVGNIGEKLTKLYLEKQGYKFIEANYYIRGGELDLIFERNNLFWFVEVKFRNSNSDDFPINNAVGIIKLLRMQKSILHWISNKKVHEEEIGGILIVYILHKFDKNIVKVVHVGL